MNHKIFKHLIIFILIYFSNLSCVRKAPVFGENGMVVSTSRHASQVGIDILKESTDGRFVNSQYLIENHWIEARKRAFRTWPVYKFVVEETNIDAAAQKIIFQNRKYRVYFTKTKTMVEPLP